MLYRQLYTICIAVFGWFFVCLGFFPPSEMVAQEQVETSSSAKLTSEELALRQDNFKLVTDLDEALKTSIQQLYERARQQLEAAKQAEAELKKHQELTNQSKALLDAAKAELELSPETTTLKLSKELTDPQLQEMLRQKNVDLEKAREKAKEAANEMARRQTRFVEFPELISKAEKKLEEVKVQLAAEAPAVENPLMTQARMTQLTAEKQNLETQLAAYNAEKSAYAVTADLPPQMDLLAQRTVKRLEAEAKKIKDRIARLRESEIEKRIRQAKEDLENAPELLKSLAEVNVVLAEKLQKTSARIAEVTRVEQQIEAARQAMSKRYETTKERVEAIGLSDTLGIMLRQNKADITKLQYRYRINPNLRDEVGEIRAEAYKSEDEANDLDNPAVAYDQVGKRLEIPADAIESLREPGVELLEKQNKAWLRLGELQNDAFNALFSLLTEQRKFAILSSEYSSYIDEHVLWVRSAKVLGASERQQIIRTINKDQRTDVAGGEVVVVQSDFTAMVEAARGIVQLENWQAVQRAVIVGAKNRFSLLLVISSGMFLLFIFHSRLKKNLRASAKIATRRSCREFTPTATSLLETILLSFLWPGVLMILGWVMRSDIVSEPFPSALGFGLSAVGLVAAPLEFLRHVCRTDGLAQAHFDWPDAARLTVRSNVRWLILFGAPLFLISVMLHHLGNADWNNSLGRICTIALLVFGLVFVYRVMRPSSPVFRSSEDRDSRFYRLRYFRFGLLVIWFVGTIIFAIAGYYYTTYQLSTNFLQTMAFAIGMLTLYCMALRFLLVRRRRLRYEQLMKQRETMQKQRLAAEALQSTDGSVPPKIPESIEVDIQNEFGTDINSVSRQAKELTGVIFVAVTLVVLWQIWQDVLPATKLLDTVELWPVAVGDTVERVSLRDLLISVGLFLVTFFSVRNIPGMLELLLLKQLPIDSGSRYAITTIFRYFIVVVGVILALNFLKIPWSKISWLVAAISVGLGFGLQEIVANFVSGLIILLERPVRVGDVVTIDGTTGIVSRIQMRATTVTNWDNQELIVPNKDLVTGKLINWTLSSMINRVSLTVGVAYGTDVDKVERLILDIVDQNSEVLADPAPVVCFEAFGDSSLNFKLRCCITSIDRRIHIIHALNSAINKSFNREGIVIPFPQRDVHMIREPEV